LLQKTAIIYRNNTKCLSFSTENVFSV
jgi:hypothetical protein